MLGAAMLCGMAQFLSDFVSWAAGLSLPDRTRARLTLGLTFAATVVGTAECLMLPPSLVRVRAHLPDWPRELDGYRVLLLSDMHIGQSVGRTAVRRAVAAGLHAGAPDLTVLCGDIVDGDAQLHTAAAAPLRELVAASRDGAWAVLGNHEHLHPPVLPSVDLLSSVGITVLRDEHVPMRGGRFALAGVDDLSTEGGIGRFFAGRSANLSAALEGAGRPGAPPTILLAHQPGHIPAAAELGARMVLSGHTHGGQIWPFHIVAHIMNPYFAGPAVVPKGNGTLGTAVYVSSGTLWWGPPVRFLAPSEVTLLTISSGELSIEIS
eukprot:TRINITY_DN9514_c0_g1_i1.p2 TRINITY_DN9514_c0_g1~~TRINITY_DN9514_c0_g1_i1.p2  ORF type:complete len:321 (+),score=94.37 TRINITY_DN9514_c0_g1_i1:466-1428(+)